MAQAGLTYFEPAFADELAVIMRWAFDHIQRDDGGSVYLRLSTRPLEQPQRGQIDADLAEAIVDGGYWLREPGPAPSWRSPIAARWRPRRWPRFERSGEDVARGRAAGRHLARPAAPRLARRRRRHGRASTAERLLGAAAAGAALVTVIDGHPATLSWLGGVARHRVVPLGVDQFGQSGDIPDLYRAYGLDADAILDAAARACLLALR